MSSEKCPNCGSDRRSIHWGDCKLFPVQAVCDDSTWNEIARAVRHYRARPKLPEGESIPSMRDALHDAAQWFGECSHEYRMFLWLRDNLPALLGDQP